MNRQSIGAKRLIEEEDKERQRPKRQIQIEIGKKGHRYNVKKRMKDPTGFWSATILDAECCVSR